MELNWNLLFVLAIIVHGIGHSLGLMHTTSLVTLSGMPTNESWLLAGQLKLDKIIIQLVSVLWFVAIIGFLLVAGAFWFELSWWKGVALAMVVLSVMLFGIWFTSFPLNTQVGAAIGNLVVLAGLFMTN
ncbi:MAG: hypothetical protein ACFFE8_05275 [Candidatus Heimdallarchaeota archaeon]